VSTFVFVHGAWHGAWCWSRLLPEMEARGHRSVVMDLPVDDGSATFEDYANAVLASYPAELEDAVLVGHSLGAMVLPLVATSRPASLLVFLCGVIPNVEGKPWHGAPPMSRPEAYQTETLDDGSSVFRTVESARLSFYADCDPEDVAWAFAHLRPQNSRSLWDRPYPLTRLPVTPRAAIAGVDDAAIDIEFSRAVTRPRLGVDLIEIPGAHSPFLARPREVASLLDRLVRS
jgi:pimeloyl-ACP methyl ester carboxylesterase